MLLIHTQIFIYLYPDICTYTSMNLHTYCQHTHIYVCIRMIMYIYIYTHFISMPVHIHEGMNTCTCPGMCSYLSLHTHTLVYIHKDMHISIYTETCVHMYAHIYAQQRDMHIYKYTCIYSTYSYTLRHIHNFIYIHIWYAHIQTFLHTETCICSSIFTHIFAHLLRYYSY